MKAKSFPVLTAMVLIVTIIVTACASENRDTSSMDDTSEPSNTSDRVTITFWKPPDTASGDDGEFFEPLINEFENQNPLINVEFLQISWDNALEKMTAAFTSNNPPDVTYQGSQWLHNFASQGALLSLEDFPESVALFDGIYPKFLESATYEGQKYGYPYMTNLWPLAVNEDIWLKAGKPKFPETYAELTEFARKLTFDSNGKNPGDPGYDKSKVETYGFSHSGDPSISLNYLFNYFYSFGVDSINKEGTDIGFNNPQGRAAMEWIKNMVDSGIATPPNLYSSFNDMTIAFAKGKIAIQWMPYIFPDMMKENPDFKYKILQVPAGPDGHRYVQGSSVFLSVAAKSKHPEEALKFIQFLLSEENLTAWLRESWYLPVKPMPEDLYKGIGVNEEFLKEAAAHEPYFHGLHIGLKYSPDLAVIGELNNFIEGRKEWDAMVNDVSSRVKQMAQNAGQ